MRINKNQIVARLIKDMDVELLMDMLFHALRDGIRPIEKECTRFSNTLEYFYKIHISEIRNVGRFPELKELANDDGFIIADKFHAGLESFRDLRNVRIAWQ